MLFSFLFFLIFIQLCDSRKISYLTREFHVKLHLKTDVVFRVQFNVGFPRQVMNFPIELRSYISGSARSAEIKEIFEKDTILRFRADVVVW